MSSYLIPNWPAPANIKAYCTTRIGGCSPAPYASFNLGDHVNDIPENVSANRKKLQEDLALPAQPKWLQQVHGDAIINTVDWQEGVVADGVFSDKPHEICAVMTADCLPILLCDQAGSQVMALHGGWRSLAAEIVPKGVRLFNAHLNTHSAEILVWLGPAIGPKVYEVGAEVRQQFLALHEALSMAFKPSSNQDRWLMDVYAIARWQLNQAGVTQIYGGERCTFTEKETFFSYRRDGLTGRMATLVFMG